MQYNSKLKIPDFFFCACAGGNTKSRVRCAPHQPEGERTDEAGSSSGAHTHCGVCGEAW